jgi:hypothetical protein
MINLETRNELLEQFKARANTRLVENCQDVDFKKYFADADLYMVKNVIKKIKDNVYGALPLGYALEKTFMYITATGDANSAMSVVNISISTSGKSAEDFKFKTAVTADSTYAVVVDYMIGVYSVLLLDAMEKVNLKKVNEVLAELAEKAGVDYSVSVVSSTDRAGRKINYMSDDTLELVADEDMVFQLDDLVVMKDVDGLIVTEDLKEQVMQQEIDAMKLAQTPEQYMKAKAGFLAGYVADVRKQVKPLTYIKKITSKNVRSGRGKKDCLMYFFEDGVFALVEQKDEQLNVVLSPFNVETYEKVDVDVLDKIAE